MVLTLARRRAIGILIVIGLGVTSTAGAAADTDANAAARDKPLDALSLLDFLDKAGHARALDHICKAVFSAQDKEIIFLAWRWAQSVARLPAYPPELMLTAIQTQGEYAKGLKSVDCAARPVKAMADSFRPFFDQVPKVVRLSEIRRPGGAGP